MSELEVLFFDRGTTFESSDGLTGTISRRIRHSTVCDKSITVISYF